MRSTVTAVSLRKVLPQSPWENRLRTGRGFLLLQLWLFHVELLRKQITTYEYLKDLERRKREKGRVVKKHPNISSEKGAVFPMQFNDSTHKSSSIYKRSILRSVFFCFTTEISNIVIDHPTNINLQANIVNRQEV